MINKDDTWVWMDLEMTGLNPFTDRILEAAVIITTNQLDVLAEGPVIAIHQSDTCLAAMDEWNKTHHQQSGLLARVRTSTYNEQQAERVLLDFIMQYCNPQRAPLCGNSICQDRRFLARWMPELEAFVHYRNLDVSSIKILAKSWAPTIAAGFKKANQHLALADIRESISELRHYRKYLLRIQYDGE
ncbi:oligoribonuclease [Thiospirillum jenense]|uniref:Oligoribonuclease n=1 Tax=Thiospirillum jenense TaxID=1653858 RepID=A0A839HDN4_9GAMM|nr:oligoribonuclease [Thiospirillum jenense]MBB1126230.1 oligoribonuclease [Thiospirillum jenense]